MTAGAIILGGACTSARFARLKARPTNVPSASFGKMRVAQSLPKSASNRSCLMLIAMIIAIIRFRRTLD